jgi:hypothetical protein
LRVAFVSRVFIHFQINAFDLRGNHRCRCRPRCLKAERRTFRSQLSTLPHRSSFFAAKECSSTRIQAAVPRAGQTVRFRENYRQSISGGSWPISDRDCPFVRNGAMTVGKFYTARPRPETCFKEVPARA